MFFCPFFQNNMYRDVVSPSYIRILHASPNAPAVDVYANDKIIAKNIRYKAFTEYLPIEQGYYNIKVYAAGTKQNAVINTDVYIPEKSIFTLAIYGELQNIGLMPILDPNLTAIKDKVFLRFIHLSPNAPAVDVTLANGTKLFKDVNYKEETSYIPINPGTYTLQARLSGTDVVVLTVPNIMLKPNRFYSAYAVGLAGKEPPLQLLVPLDGNSYIKF